MGRSEMLTGGRRKTALLGDAMEAVIAAVYLDGGLEAARRLILRALGRADRRGAGRRAATPRPRCRNGRRRAGCRRRPIVDLDREGPDHAPVFSVEARLEDGRAAEGRAASKRAAQQAAAEALLAPAGGARRDAAATRCGLVALIGEPNAGKSTLLNRMVGAKVSIVTHKVQTTRTRIRGIAIEGAAQLVFVDTPGLFRPRRRLDRAMVKAAWGGAADADVVVLLIEAHRGLTEGVRAILDAAGGRSCRRGATVALAINKIDRVPAERLLALQRRDERGCGTSRRPS